MRRGVLAVIALLTSDTLGLVPAFGQNGWRMPMFDTGNTNSSPVAGPASEPTVQTLLTGSSASLIGIADDGSILLQDSGQLRCLTRTLQPKWNVPLVGLVDAVIGSTGIVYARVGDQVVALNKDTGAEQWRSETIKRVEGYGSLRIGRDDTVYTATGAYLTAIASNGTKKWELNVGFAQPPNWMLSTDESLVYISNCYGSYDCGSDAYSNTTPPSLVYRERDIQPGSFSPWTTPYMYGRFYPVYACLVNLARCASIGDLFEPANIFTLTSTQLLVTNTSGVLKAYDRTPALKWTSGAYNLTGGFSDGTGVLQMLISTSGSPTTDGAFVAVDSSTGIERWRAPLPRADHRGFLLGPEGCLYAMLGNGSLVKVCSSTPVGTINVTTNLPAATFTISGPATYPGSGTSFTQSNAPTGTYTINYGVISGYTSPPPETKVLINGGIIAFTGTYRPSLLLSPTSLTFQYQTTNPGAIAPQQLWLSSTAGLLPFTVTVSTIPPGGTWLSATPSSGTASQTGGTVSAAVKPGLPAGTYSGTIIISAPQAANPVLSIPISLVIAGPRPVKNNMAVIVVPGMFGSKLATANQVVWLSNQTIKDMVSLKHTLDALQYTSAGEQTVPLGIHAITQQGDFGDIFNLYSLKGTASYALDCGTILGAVADWLGADCQSNINIYNRLTSELTSQGLAVFTFPYDWRRDISAISEDLFNLTTSVRAQGYDRIAIIAHSMGGLITEQLVVHHSEEISPSLQSIVTLGTPFRGSVQSYLYFQGWGPPFIPHVVSSADLQRIGSNWSSSYQLLPQYNFASVDGTLEPFPETYEGTRVGAPLPRREALTAAYNLWMQLAPPMSMAYAIIGIGQQTPIAVAVSTGENCRRALLGDGDGTVPLGSAQGSTWIDSGRTWYVSAKHSELPSDGQVITAIMQILKGTTPTNLKAQPSGVKPGLWGCF